MAVHLGPVAPGRRDATLGDAEDEAGGFIEREGPRIPPANVLIHASLDGLVVGTSKVGDWSWSNLQLSRSMHEEFSEKEAFLKRMKIEEAPVYAVAIERNVPAAHAARLLNLLAQKPLALAFRAPAIGPRFRVPASVREEHPRYFQPAQNRQRMDEPAPAPPTCPEMIELGNVLTRIRPAIHWELLERYLGERWVTCECELDMEQKLVMLTARYDVYPLATMLPIHVTRSAEPLVVRADATWAEIVPRVETSTGPLHFALEGDTSSPEPSLR